MKSVAAQSSANNNNHCKLDFCKDIDPKISAMAFFSPLLALFGSTGVICMKSIGQVALFSGFYCEQQRRKKEGINDLRTKAADLMSPMVQHVTHIFERTANKLTKISSMLDTFMCNEVAKFNVSRCGQIPLVYQVSKHIESAVEKYDWSEQLGRQFETLLWYHIGRHVQYNDLFDVEIVSPIYESVMFDEGELENQIKKASSILQEIIEPGKHALSEAISGSPMGQYMMKGSAPSRDTFEQMMSDSIAKMVEVLAAEENSDASHLIAKQYSPKIEERTLFSEVSHMMQDAQMLATIFKKPEIAEGISNVKMSIDRFSDGLMRLNHSTNVVSSLAATLSLFTGFSGIISGIFSFFSGTASALEKISKQLNQLGQQLDCVLKNQQKMMDVLFLNSKQLTDIQGQLRRFAASTRQQLDFIATQDLIQATNNIKRHLETSSAIPASQDDLSSWVRTLQTWLLDPQHLCSRQMNGSLMNWHEIAPASESVDILSLALNDQFDDQSSSLSSLNYVGFVIGQLRFKGIDLSDTYFSLPPLMLYMQTVVIYYFGLTNLTQINQIGAERVSKELCEICHNYEAFIKQLKLDGAVVYKKLKSLYQHDLNKVKAKLVYFINKYIDKTDHPFKQEEEGVDKKPLLLHCGTVAEILKSEFFTQVERAEFLDLLNAAEENRLLFCLLSQWSDSHVLEAKSLKSRHDILNQHINFFDEVPLLGEYFSQINLSRVMTYWTTHHLYEPILLYFSLLPSDWPRKKYYFPSWSAKEAIVRGTYEELKNGKNGKVNTEFQAIVSWMMNESLSQPLHTAFRYYWAYANHDSDVVEALRDAVDPKLLLWLTAFLGRFDIFKSINLPENFVYMNANAKIEFGTYHNVYLREPPYYFTMIFLDSPYFLKDCDYTIVTTPLMIASKWNRMDVVRGLIDESRKGVNVGFLEKDPTGRRASQIAYENGHIEINQLLTMHEKLADKYGETDAFRFIRLPQAYAINALPITLRQESTHDVLMRCITLCGELAANVAHITPLKRSGNQESAFSKVELITDTAGADNGEITDIEDEEDLNQMTQAFCANNQIAFSSSMWKKPKNVASGVRKMSRNLLQSKSATFFRELKRVRGEKEVTISETIITVQLLCSVPNGLAP